MTTLAPVEIFVRNAIYAQTLFILLLSGYTLGAMMMRRRKAHYHETLKTYYGDIIVELLIQDASVEFTLPLPTHGVKRDALQISLLENIGSITGAERGRLEALYMKLGFLKVDAELATSFFRSRRIKSVSHLIALRNEAAAPLLRTLSRDPDKLVRAAAYLALSSLPESLDASTDLREVSMDFVYRRGALCYLLSNIVSVRGVAVLFPLLQRSSPIHLHDACLQVLMTSRAPEATPYLCRALSKEDLAPATVTAILDCLKQMGDPDSVTEVKHLLAHPDERIRIRSFDLVLALSVDELELAPVLTQMAVDDSQTVRKMASAHLDRKVAA